MLSRYLSKVPTKSRIFCALKVLKYLGGTRAIGIEYSRNREQAFNHAYSSDGHGQRVDVGEFNLFTDASFAAKIDDHYSVNGLLLYYAGTPVAWKSGRQSIRSESTCQAEWIACAEGLKWIERMGFLTFFQQKYDQTAPIPDSMTLWTDSESVEACALAIEAKPASRHFILREYKVREFSDKNPQRLRFCRTEYQRADALTKGTELKQHQLILNKVNQQPISKISIMALFEPALLGPMPSANPGFSYHGPPSHLQLKGKNAYLLPHRPWDGYAPAIVNCLKKQWAGISETVEGPECQPTAVVALGQTFQFSPDYESLQMRIKRIRTKLGD